MPTASKFMRVLIYGTLTMAAWTFTGKSSTYHILKNKSHIKNNDAAEKFIFWIQQKNWRLVEKNEAGKDIFSWFKDCKTSYHSLLSYTKLPFNVFNNKKKNKNRLTDYKTDSKWKKNWWRFGDEALQGT